MPDELVNQIKPKLEASLSHFREDLSKLRTGRAHSSMLDKVMVSAYGTSMPLKQLANVSAPEPQLLQIRPFDATNIQAISSAIRDDQNLGLNPVDDGMVVRINIPPLTSERRSEIVKQLSGLVEECLISMRGYRHDCLKEAESYKKDKKITQDDYTSVQKLVDELMNNYKNQVEGLAKTKEAELMKI
ncbi:MAG TPA: ribosome recycling factor [Candidatus Saccharimonadales bacterium]|nr:ribosome recycling factor [Candidatus Saccharimonadales bacterium]